MGHISIQQLLDLCDPKFGDKCIGETLVLTPNNRLSRFLHRQFDHLNVARGKQAWVPLQCWSLQLWLKQQWLYFSALNPEEGGKHLLTHSQSLLMWQEIIAKSDSAEALFNGAAAAETALRAWNTLAQWQVEWRQIKNESPAFVEWADQYHHRCVEDNFIDDNIVMHYLGDFLETNPQNDIAKTLPAQIILLSFDAVSPLFENLIRALEVAGVRIIRHSLHIDNASASRLAIVDARNEIKCAAHWAHEKLSENSQRQIGIVVPDLTKRRVEVETAFYDVFEPQYKLPDRPRHAPPFNISASVPLNTTPPVAAALLALQCNRHKLSIEDVVVFLHSPFIGRVKDMDARALLSEKLEAEYLELSPTKLRVSAGEFLKINGAAPLNSFHDALVNFSSIIRDEDKKLKPSEWAEKFEAQLDALSWPGERNLDTLEYQQVEHWKRALEEFCQLDRVVGKISLSRALDYLQRVVKDTPFQAKTDYSPVQILGLLEASGLVFDDLWVMGLDDENWPPKIQPNPLIPLALQRQKHMPRASVDKELELASDITTRFSKSARNIVFSYPQQSGDKHLSPSALIAPFPEMEITQVLKVQPASYAEELMGCVTLEKYTDVVAGTLKYAEDIRGGTQILKDQATCPFKAFATHRLVTKIKERAQPGYTAQDRGSLVHLSLELVWKSLRNFENLQNHTNDELHSLVEKSIEASFQQSFSGKFAKGDKKGVVLTALEKARLTTLILLWLQLEKSREPFDVVLNEGRQNINIKGLPISLRFDRMDKIENGGHLILDYKTGTKSLSSWEGSRPDDPQVPLYSVAHNLMADPKMLSAVAFAQVNIEDLAFKGIGESSDLVHGIKAPQDLKRYAFAEDWSSVLNDWKVTLEKLAEEFLQGDAKVDPKRGAASCQYCHLKTLCRVSSRLEASANEVEAND